MDTSKAKKAKAENTEERKTLKNPEYSVSHVRVWSQSNKNDVVFFTLEINGISINGCKVIEGKNGDFIGFPSQKGKDDTYYPIVWVPLAEEDVKAILALVQEELNK